MAITRNIVAIPHSQFSNLLEENVNKAFINVEEKPLSQDIESYLERLDDVDKASNVARFFDFVIDNDMEFPLLSEKEQRLEHIFPQGIDPIIVEIALIAIMERESEYVMKASLRSAYLVEKLNVLRDKGVGCMNTQEQLLEAVPYLFPESNGRLSAVENFSKTRHLLELFNRDTENKGDVSVVPSYIEEGIPGNIELDFENANINPLAKEILAKVEISEEYLLELFDGYSDLESNLGLPLPILLLMRLATFPEEEKLLKPYIKKASSMRFELADGKMLLAESILMEFSSFVEINKHKGNGYGRFNDFIISFYGNGIVKKRLAELPGSRINRLLWMLSGFIISSTFLVACAGVVKAGAPDQAAVDRILAIAEEAVVIETLVPPTHAKITPSPEASETPPATQTVVSTVTAESKQSIVLEKVPHTEEALVDALRKLGFEEKENYDPLFGSIYRGYEGEVIITMPADIDKQALDEALSLISNGYTYTSDEVDEKEGKITLKLLNYNPIDVDTAYESIVKNFDGSKHLIIVGFQGGYGKSVELDAKEVKPFGFGYFDEDQISEEDMDLLNQLLALSLSFDSEYHQISGIITSKDFSRIKVSDQDIKTIKDILTKANGADFTGVTIVPFSILEELLDVIKKANYSQSRLNAEIGVGGLFRDFIISGVFSFSNN